MSHFQKLLQVLTALLECLVIFHALITIIIEFYKNLNLQY